MSSRKDICFKPIGYVVEGISKKGDPHRKKIKSKYEYVSKIRVLEKYKSCLHGLEDFSHIIVIWYSYLSEDKDCLVRPMNRDDMPLVGVFATRSPRRPNPVCVSIVELMSINGLELNVRGLDAWVNTVVLDIKPYTYYDIIRRPRVSKWLEKYWGKTRR